MVTRSLLSFLSMAAVITKIKKIPKSINTLKILFILTLAGHFISPVIDNPLNNLFSDPARHWQNGNHLFGPTFIGAMDPKLYQLFIYLLKTISGGSRLVIGVFSGLMSAGMVYFWYRACREIYKKESALFLGVMIGICPSFIPIYSYFMNETLVLFMLSLCFWLGFRAIRKKTAGSAILAACAIVLSFYTRLAIIPVLLAVMWFMLYHIKKRRQAITVSALLFCICTLFAGLHGYKQLNVFAPFGFKEMNQFYFLSGDITFHIQTPNGGKLGFSSPSYHYPVGSPFFNYSSYRSVGPALIKVDPANGIKDWKKEIARVKQGYGLDKFLGNLQDNAVFLAFANSWPDSSHSYNYKTLLLINFHARWMWAPLMILLLIATPFTRATRPEMLVLCCAYGLLISLVLQQLVMIEGRYRKPLEPLLIICAYAILRNKALDTTRQMPGLVSAYSFITETYLKPVYAFIIRK